MWLPVVLIRRAHSLVLVTLGSQETVFLVLISTSAQPVPATVIQTQHAQIQQAHSSVFAKPVTLETEFRALTSTSVQLRLATTAMSNQNVPTLLVLSHARATLATRVTE